MKRFMVIALALMAMAVFAVPSASAQAPSAASTATTANGPLVRVTPKCVRGSAIELEGQDRFAYCWESAGTAPLVFTDELAKLKSPTVGYNEVELLQMLTGERDDISRRGLRPVSERQRRSIALLAFKDVDALEPDPRTPDVRNPRWESILSQIASGAITEYVIPAGSHQLDLGMTYMAGGITAVTTLPPTPVDFDIHGYLLPGIRLDNGQSIQLFFFRRFGKDGVFKDPCVNVSGMFFDTPTFTGSGSPVPQAPPTTDRVAPPAIPAAAPPPDFGGRFWNRLALGIGGQWGWLNHEYSGVRIPRAGDAEQRNNFAGLFPIVRFEPSGSGPLVAANGTILNWTGKKEALDAWFVKQRDEDKTKDTRIEALVGWQFPVAQFMVGPFVGWRQDAEKENYSGQGAVTNTRRIYQGPMAGVQLGWATDEEDPDWHGRLLGHYGWVTRKSWTHQTYPGITFPRVNHPDQKGHSIGIRPELERRIIGPLHGLVGFDWQFITSRRPNTFEAKERTTFKSLWVGVNYRF